MVLIDDRPEACGDRRAPGLREDPIIGKGGKSVAATLVERTSRFVILLALAAGKDAVGVADVLIDRVNDFPVTSPAA